MKIKRNPIVSIQLSLRFAKEYLDALCEMRKSHTEAEIQTSKTLTIIHRALWTSLIIEVGRLFDTHKTKEVISLKNLKLPKVKKDINRIHGETIVGKIIDTRKTFTAHWDKEGNDITSVTEICNSKLGKLLYELNELLIKN